MEKGLFHDLYNRLGTFDTRFCPPEIQSCLLHGYLTVYSMVRVYPWLEEDFGLPGANHERAKEVARLYFPRLNDVDEPVDVRVGYAADLMDVYQLYSDLCYLKAGLDAAYALLMPGGRDRVLLPCRTPNVCRMLCNCYYFAEDKVCGELAGRLVTEALGYIRGGDRAALHAWWNTICLYDDVVGTMELTREERERLKEERARLKICVEREEDAKIGLLCQARQDADFSLVAEVFCILAKREFEECNNGKRDRVNK